MKQLEVTILGQSYLLACPEGGETLLLAAVGRVDQEMSAIRDAGKVRARERIAVLAALNLAYQMAETAEAPASAAPAAPHAQAEPEAADPDADATVARLIARIDGALGRDGHLL
ncbi:MAG: cell division protein ZapA [Proteobacteria bacterium]|nr:cell division protein ZapA [Pseudomonadota bacterium]